MSELENKFNCELCNFTCNKKSNWDRHCLTAKHIKKTNNDLIKESTDNKWKCECGKIYKVKSSYYYHKKNSCDYIQRKDETEKLLKIVDTLQELKTQLESFQKIHNRKEK